MRFEFATANQIAFGPGTFEQAGAAAAGLGKHALVVVGTGAVQPDALIEQLQAAEISWELYSTCGEPTIEGVRVGVDLARQMHCDLVIAMGGGSVLDTGKAIAGLAPNLGEITDYLEVIGKGEKLRKPALPFLAIPTTAGTGSEVTRNAVLAATDQRVKVSLRSPFLLPRIALVDPLLTHSLPPEGTASTGMDALVQVIEPYVSAKANPFTDGFCREGIQNASWALRRAFHAGSDAPAREAMSYTSLLGGLALANSGLGAVHGFAAPIGGAFPAPHGAVCAVLAAQVMRANLRALRERMPENPALARYTQIAAWLTRKTDAAAEDGVTWLGDLCAELHIPPLSTYGIARVDIPALVEKAAVASSMKANPIRLTEDEMSEILVSCL